MSLLVRQSTQTLRCFRSALLILLAMAGGIHATTAQELRPPSTIDSQVVSVTVFRQQANVVREVQVPAVRETQIVRVNGFPSSMIGQTIGWDSDADVTVQSFRVERHQQEANRVDDGERDREIQERNAALQVASQQVAVIEQDLETIEALVDFSSGKTRQDLDHSKLDVASLTAVTDFVMQRRRSLAEELHLARSQVQRLQQEAEQSLQEPAADRSADPASTFDATLVVNAPQGGVLRLSYWVDGVSWEPRYTIHASTGADHAAGGGQDRVLIQLDAKVTQSSGENWDAVAMMLCTGIPNLQASGPLLVPLRVSVDGAAKHDANSSAAGRVAGAGVLPIWEDPESWQQNLVLNTIASKRQVNELNRDLGVQRELAEDAGGNFDDEVYQVAGRIDVPDQAGEQTVTVLRSEAATSIYRVVTPLLSSTAYREVTLENSLGQNMVGGEATVMLDGRFVGQMALPPTATGGEYKIGLGTDRRVRARRELLRRDATIQGGNRLSKMQYRLAISNFHVSQIKIRLFDRIPIASDAEVINVVSDASSLGELSNDGKYLRIQRPTGILRWDLMVPGDRFGSEAYDHEYSYTVETERSRSIVSRDAQQIQSDLNFNRSGGGGMGGGMGGPF